MSQKPSLCEERIYNEIYRTHANNLRNYLYYKYGDLEKSEDIVQDSFLRLWVKCSDIIFEKVAGFLYKVANNLFLDNLRSKKVALKFEKEQLPKVDTEDPYFQLRTQEFQNHIETIISNLPTKQREAFLMNRIDRLTYKEIAIRLEISQTAVEKRIANALVKLKEAIDELKDFSI